MRALRSRENFVLGLTLTESIILLFFVLLIVAVLQIRRVEARIEEERESHEAEAERMMEAKSLLESVLDEIVAQEDTDDPNKIVKMVLAMKRRLGDEQKRVAQLVEESKRRELLIAQMRKEISECDESLNLCEQRSTDLANEAEKLTDRGEFLKDQVDFLGRGGRDHPPCWIDKRTKKVEFIYAVTIRENDVGVVAIWPGYRNDEASDIPGSEFLAAESLTIERFLERSASIYKWSTEQDPECRHYVKIYDEAETKDGYKTKRLKIERRFYKLEIVRPRSRAKEGSESS